MTTTEATSGERIVVIPEITVPASVRDAAARTLALLEELEPRLRELQEAALEVRAANDEVLVALYPHIGDLSKKTTTDEMYDIAGKATGWDEVWEQVAHRVGDLFEHDLCGAFQTTGLEMHEIVRGGERDFPKGTIAKVPAPVEPGVYGEPGDPVRVIVDSGPQHPLAEGGYLCRVLDESDERQILCSHDEIRSGFESAPVEGVAK